MHFTQQTLAKIRSRVYFVDGAVGDSCGIGGFGLGEPILNLVIPIPFRVQHQGLHGEDVRTPSTPSRCLSSSPCKHLLILCNSADHPRLSATPSTFAIDKSSKKPTECIACQDRPAVLQHKVRSPVRVYKYTLRAPTTGSTDTS